MAKRTCLWLDETHEAPDNPGFFIPNLVVEDEAGYSPLTGNGAFARPWYFGPGIEAAKAQVADYNALTDITPADALDIVLSSMRASNLGARR